MPHRPEDTVEGITATVDALPIVPKPLPAQNRAAALFVCSQATDVEDARQLLEALGLTGRPMRSNRRSLGTLGTLTLRHGTRSGVEAHRAEGHALCDACERWQQVEDRRLRRAQEEATGHGLNVYLKGDCRCQVCQGAYSKYRRERRAQGKSS
jgi:hypothetical protein